MSIPMALVDYIPVALFLAAAIVLQRELYPHMSKGAFALFSSGTIMIFTAGFFKATWKLLYAANVCDFTALNRCFFPMQTTGFLLAALGLVALLSYPQGEKKLYSVPAPVVFAGTMLFVLIMVVSVAAMDISLIILAARRKRRLAIPLLILSFVLTLGMGYLSSKDFTRPAMNWIAEGVNTVGQGAFLAGALLLRKKKSEAAA